MRLSNTTTRFLQNNKHIKERQSQFFRNIHAYVSYESVNSTGAEHYFNIDNREPFSFYYAVIITVNLLFFFLFEHVTTINLISSYRFVNIHENVV